MPSGNLSPGQIGKQPSIMVCQVICMHLHPNPGGYLAFLGRIAPEKRPDHAIEIAKRVGIPLRIAAKVDPADQEYFHTEIEPLLSDPLIEYLGEITDAEKDEFLGNAIAFVCPYDWPEPFGLVLIESLACGTPVLAYRRGSIPEIIEDRVTGFVCEGLDEMTAAIQRIPEIDRRTMPLGLRTAIQLWNEWRKTISGCMSGRSVKLVRRKLRARVSPPGLLYRPVYK